MSNSKPLALLSEDDNTRYSAEVKAGKRPGDAHFDAFCSGAVERAEPLAGKIDTKPVTSKWELADTLNRALAAIQRSHPKTLQDSRLWNYLTICWKEQVWGHQSRNDNYVFAGEGLRTAYRHRLAGPYFIARRFGGDERVKTLLSAIPADIQGDVLEQLLGREYTMQSNGAWLAAAELYVDSTGKLKRGRAGKGPGSVRRYCDVVRQLAVTYDIYKISPDQILRLLPSGEFSKFMLPAGT